MHGGCTFFTTPSSQGVDIFYPPPTGQNRQRVGPLKRSNAQAFWLKTSCIFLTPPKSGRNFLAPPPVVKKLSLPYYTKHPMINNIFKLQKLQTYAFPGDLHPEIPVPALIVQTAAGNPPGSGIGPISALNAVYSWSTPATFVTTVYSVSWRSASDNTIIIYTEQRTVQAGDRVIFVLPVGTATQQINIRINGVGKRNLTSLSN